MPWVFRPPGEPGGESGLLVLTATECYGFMSSLGMLLGIFTFLLAPAFWTPPPFIRLLVLRVT